jgi:hypothetical protein
MSYEEDDVDSEITVDTCDEGLIDTTVPHSICYELVNYPKDTNANAPKDCEEKPVKYVSACPNPTAFSANDQIDPAPVTISEDPVTISTVFTPHTIEPSYCKVEYTCSDVRRDDGVSHGLSCEFITLDPTCEEEDNSDCKVEGGPVDP